MLAERLRSSVSRRLTAVAFVMIAACFALAACSSESAKPDGGLTPPMAPTGTPESHGTLAWVDCGDGFECSELETPLDAMSAPGTSISIALIRLPATNPAKRIGSLLTNPGGPGGSGVDFVRDAARDVFGDDVRARFDVVGFDPRGVGGSKPAVDCIDDIDAYIAESDEPETQDKADKGFADACNARSGLILPYLSATHVARDMDAIRIALGEDKLTYLGFSYGTLLGAVYADMFPDHVRALVLDGAVDPELDREEHTDKQDDAFDDALDAFLNTCGSDSGCPFYSDGDPFTVLEDLLDSIETAPLPVKASGDSRTVDLDTTWTAIDAALYDRDSGWPALASALQIAATESDGSELLAIADQYNDRSDDGTYSNEFEANIAISCVDAPHPAAAAATAEASDAAAAGLPRPPGLRRTSPCSYWPVQADRTPVAIVARNAPAIVVVGTTRDPATPYDEARGLAAHLASGRLLTYDGDGHTAYGGKSDCIDDAVDAYLIALTLPERGKVCT